MPFRHGRIEQSTKFERPSHFQIRLAQALKLTGLSGGLTQQLAQ